MAQTSRIRIEGMHCASCVARVESAVRAVPGVVEVRVNLATNEARVTGDHATFSSIRQAIESQGYQARLLDESERRSSSTETLRQTLREELPVASLLTACVVVVATLSFVSEITRLGEVAMLGLTVLVLIVAGREFLARAANSLWHGHLDMDVLISLGSLSALGSGIWSFAQTGQHSSHDPATASQPVCGSDFLAAVLIVFFVWIGRRLESHARRQASNAIDKLLDLQAPTAHVIRTSGDLLAQETEIELPVDQVAVGNVALVRAGERVPVDGVVLVGITEIDESSFTGEPLPVRKQPGDRVLGGSVNQSGTFRFRTERVGDEMTLRRIAALVRDAQGSKAPIARLADRVAGVFVPIVMAIALLTLMAWLNHSDAHTAISRAVAVLVVACPCALGLATPTAVMVAMGKGAEFGVLFKDGEALERTASLQIALFDKTGTLTEGQPEIVEVVPAENVTRDELLRVAARIASGSNHPLARAVVVLAKQESIPLDATPDRVHSEPGLGLKAEIDGQTVLLGNRRWIEQSQIQSDVVMQSLDFRGRTPLFVSRGTRVLGMLTAEDRLRPSAAEATLALRQLHIESGLVSGDRLEVVRNVANKLGISLIEAERLPSEKSEVVRGLQATGRRVGMIGDGVNDAPALAAADVGFAIGAGADVAIEAADVTLVGSDPRAVPHAIELARRTLTIIRQNLFFAFAYNVVAIPLAAGLLSALGAIIIPPGFAAAAMSASSILVVTNSLRLRHFRHHAP